MSVTKVIGYQRIAGEKSKKTGQPYDYTKIYLIDNSNPDVSGYEPVEIFLSTDELKQNTGVDFLHLAEVINNPVKLDFSFVSGRPRAIGFHLVELQ